MPALETRSRESSCGFRARHGRREEFLHIGWRGGIVAGGAMLLIGLANLGAFVSWLGNQGVLAWARRACDQYVTGTSITVIAALLILLPSGTVIAICAQRCRVCDALLLRRGKYCSECGSRA